MEKSNYKLFFYLGDKPININLKHALNPQSSQSNETRAKLFNQDIQKNIYTKAKQNYEFLMKKNKNIYMLNKKGGKFPSKEYLEALENIDKKIKKENNSLLPFPQHKKENNKSVEELRRMQRNKVTMRRIEYSMKVKHSTNKKRCKYNIKKVITIQKWVRGFLLRNLLSNLSYFEDFTNEFMEHIKKFVFLKHKKTMKDIIKYLQYKLNKNSINEIKNNNNNIKNSSNNNSSKKEISLDIIKENSNERYIDEDSIMEYNNRYNKNSNDFTNKNRKEINNINNNILFFSSKDFSDKIILNQKSNNFNNDSNSNFFFNSNNNPFKLSESSITQEKNKENNLNNNKKEETLNSNKEENFNTLKNEEARDLFNAKHSNDLIEPSPELIKNITTNNVKTEENDNIVFNNNIFNNQLLIRRPKLNRKFIEEINNTHASATPTKYNNFLNNNTDVDIKKNQKEKEKNEKNKNGKNSNSIKLNNQAGSISNPTNSTLDSNTLNINRKIFLDENFNINNNIKKPKLEKEKEKEKVKKNDIINIKLSNNKADKDIINKNEISSMVNNLLTNHIKRMSIKKGKNDNMELPKFDDINLNNIKENFSMSLLKDKNFDFKRVKINTDKNNINYNKTDSFANLKKNNIKIGLSPFDIFDHSSFEKCNVNSVNDK